MGRVVGVLLEVNSHDPGPHSCVGEGWALGRGGHLGEGGLAAAGAVPGHLSPQ